MFNRPKDFFVQVFRSDDPVESERRGLVECYNSGGLSEYEFDFKKSIGSFGISPVILEKRLCKVPRWVYVGGGWWCRKYRKRYEFRRLFAVYNYGPNVNKLAGLWDDRRHLTKRDSFVVFRDGRSGVIVEYNNNEFVVRFDDGGSMICRSVGDVVFKYIEDFQFFSRLLVKHVSVAKKVF